MSNTFEIKRFGNYLLHDIRTAVADSGLALVIIGAMPIFQFLIPEVFSLVFSGHAMDMGTWGKIPAYISALTIANIFFPIRPSVSSSSAKRMKGTTTHVTSSMENHFSRVDAGSMSQFEPCCLSVSPP